MRTLNNPSVKKELPYLIRVLVLLALMVCAPSGLFLAQTSSQKPVHAESHRQDSMAIYSLLLPGALFSGMNSSQNQSWAIAATTVSAQDINPALAPEAALQPPPDHPKWFRDAVADYEVRKNQRVLLTHDLKVSNPYVLLSPAEVDEFRATRASVSPNASSRQKYAGFPGITYFSDVYFNPSHTGALVYMLDWCGNLCAQAEWVYLEKHQGLWVRRSGQGSS